MSIVTLKQKAGALYNKNHSVNGNFALNGVLRTVAVGPINLARKSTNTPFKNGLPKGHGGGGRCRYGGNRGRALKRGPPHSVQIHYSCTPTYQTEIKRSVMNNKGKLEQQYTGLLHGAYPRSVVQPMNHLTSSEVTVLAAAEVFTCPVKPPKTCANEGTVFAKQLTVDGYEKRNLVLKAGSFCAVPHYPFRKLNGLCRVES